VSAARIALHSFALELVTMASVAAGFAVYRTTGLSEQVAIQTLVAGIVCTALFALWGWASHRASSGRLALRSLREIGWTYGAAFVWTPIVLIPVHYLMRGYLTSFSNVLVAWVFQVPFNLLALMVANGRLLLDEGDRSRGPA
jgi:hypothetical protein